MTLKNRIKIIKTAIKTYNKKVVSRNRDIIAELRFAIKANKGDNVIHDILTGYLELHALDFVMEHPPEGRCAV